MSSLVLLSEQPASIELAQLIDRLASAGEESGLIALAKDASKASQLLDQAVFKNASLVWSSSDEDVSAVISLGLAVASGIESSSDLSSALTKLAALLTAEPAARSALKIKLLNNLINVSGSVSGVSSSQRFQLLLQLLEFASSATTAAGNGASASSPAALVLQPLSTLSSIVDFWKLTPEQSLQLYSASYKLSNAVAARTNREQPTTLYSLGTQPTVQQEYLVALLRAVDAAASVNPAVLKEKSNQDLAVNAVISSIGSGLSSTIHAIDTSNLFPLTLIQSLTSSNNVNAAAAVALLKIVVDADLSGFAAFEKSHAGFLKENAVSLDSSTLLRKIRTLALCQLAVANQSNTVDNVLSYAAIRTKLGLKSNNAEEVEEVVIDAVMAGRIDAKMDQEAETLCVKRIVGGVPQSLYAGANSKAAWSALGARLKSWKQNLHTVLTTLNVSQQMVEPSDEDIQ